MSSKYTPGPWGLGKNLDGRSTTIYGADRQFVAEALRDDVPATEAEANARLIHAAPDLYEAAKAFLATGDGRALRAAIAKAEGRAAG